jgi:hypothetical protein
MPKATMGTKTLNLLSIDHPKSKRPKGTSIKAHGHMFKVILSSTSSLPPLSFRDRNNSLSDTRPPKIAPKTFPIPTTLINTYIN